MAKYMLMFVGDDEEWRASQTKEEIQRAYAEIGKWWSEQVDKGVIKEGEELGPSRKATTVRRVNGKMIVTDGPFIESKETVGGFALIDVPDLDAAIAVAKGWPGGDVEVRPVVER
jgi:hypothetical protein